MSSEFKYFKKNNIKLTGVIHVGAHRGEEIHQYEDLGVKQVIWVEPNPEIFKEMDMLQVIVIMKKLIFICIMVLMQDG